MTDSSEKREDVVYVYINSFEYKEKKYHDMMGGHPVPGRIYRAFFDKEQALYRILFDDKQDTKYTGLVVSDLIKEDSRWKADMEILDDDTILQHDITAEDYTKLASWKEVANNDIEHLRIENSTGVASGYDNGVTKLVFSTPQEVPVTNLLSQLSSVDPDMGLAMGTTIKGILSYLESCEPNEPDLTRLLSTSRINGKGANCGIAIEALTEYLHNDSYLAAGTLTKAVYYLLREIARINKGVNE